MNNAKLQLTNGYDVDFDQLARFLRAAEVEGHQPPSLAGIAKAIGSTERQAKDIGSIAHGFGLTERKTRRPSSLGKTISTHDSFFDDLGTLWFLHYAIASQQRNLVWNLLVNELVPKGKRFSREDFLAVLAGVGAAYSAYSASAHVGKEVRVVLEAYTSSNFTRLAYLRAEGTGYRLGHREAVPPLALAACIAWYREHYRSGDSAISVADLLESPNSPGLVCQIPESRLRASLEELKTEQGFSLESRADLDQVRLTDGTRDFEWLERYYDRR